MSKHHFVAHLTGKAAAKVYRNLADQTDKSGNGIRIIAWRRLCIIFETSKQPKRLLATDREVPVETLLGTVTPEKREP